MNRHNSILLLFVCLSIFVCSCMKSASNGEPDISGAATIFGEWQWLRSATTTTEVSPDPGTVVSLVCNQDSTYSLRLNDNSSFSGRLTSARLADMENAILLDFGQNMILEKLRLQQKSRIGLNTGESLLLLDHGITDGYTHYFKKVTR